MPIRFFTIGQVADKTGLPAHTLRYWEQEFKNLNPMKSRSGRRRYSEEDVKLVRKIQNLLHSQGYTIKGAREILEGNQKPTRGQAVVTKITPAGKTEREVTLERKLSAMKKHLQSLYDLLS